MHKAMTSHGVNKKRLGFFFLAGLLLALALVFLPSVKDRVQAEGNTIDGDVKGWMWSSNIGWVKLDTGASQPVTIEANLLKGYGWSSNLGWIKFDPEGPYPAEPDNSVQIDVSNMNSDNTYPVTGWAQACSVFKAGCTGELRPDSARGGWEGWVKMASGGASGDAFYDPATKVFSGFAWGGLNTGWLKFFSSGSIDEPPFDCETGVNCLCTDPEPPISCVHCVGPNCGSGPQTLSVSCSITLPSGRTSYNVEVNDTITWTASASGGSGPYTYTWENASASTNPFQGETDNPPGENVSSFNTQYSDPGTYSMQVTATDASGTSDSAVCKIDGSTDGITINPNETCGGKDQAPAGIPPACCSGFSEGSDEKCHADVTGSCLITLADEDKYTMSYFKDTSKNDSKAKKVDVTVSDCGASYAITAVFVDGHGFTLNCDNGGDCANLSEGTHTLWVTAPVPLPEEAFGTTVDVKVNGATSLLDGLLFDYIVTTSG